jgi:sialate O-acetylesterase
MKKPAYIQKKNGSFAQLNFALAINILFVFHLFPQTSVFRLAPLFQDNMVLQQQRDVPIWGKGIPGTNIIIKASWGKTASAIVRPDSNWMVKLSTPKAGGPFQLSIRHGNSLSVIRNILAGEVWLCSGQSNMEMPLEGWPPSDTILNSANEIDQALYPSIRLFTVMHAYEAAPTDMCTGSWVECSPVDVRGFSAAAFYFGKMLYTSLKVPIGLINSNFGGTFVEAWMDKESLMPFEEYAATLKKLDESRASFHSLTQWIIKHPSITIQEQDPLRKWLGLNFQDELCSLRNYNDSTWQEMKLPTLWEQSTMGEFDGVVWFRKQVTIPLTWKGKEIVLQLGPIDDMDETYVNGKKVGEYMSDGFYNVNRVYKIPGSLIQDSLLQIAVRVIDLRGGGGIWGKGIKMVVAQDTGSAGISIEGMWKYLPVAELRSNIFYVYGAGENEYSKRPKLPLNFSQDTPTSLFNGMINPLIPFALKGVIWYQGENNVSHPMIYNKLFSSLITGWRKDFQSGDFPFYFVQIAPNDYGTNSKSQLLREAQLKTLSVKNTGMAVTIDIGNPKNIHPSNKEDVGKRLAFWALAKTYHKKIPFSGPLYKSMKSVRSEIILSFDYSGSGLVLKPKNGELNFLIAGQDKVFRKAMVRVQGRTLIVSNPEISMPIAVRYAWSNVEEGTLFNREGLPASSFRTDDWKE